jgi:hypothetical protein
MRQTSSPVFTGLRRYLSATLITAAFLGFALAPTASAREVNILERAHLHWVGGHGSSLVEQGNATGTYNCVLNLHLTLTSLTTARGTFVAYPRGGSISGSASGHLRLSGSSSRLEATLSISHGSGSFSHAYGRGLRVTGLLDRRTYNMSVQLTGKLRL